MKSFVLAFLGFALIAVCASQFNGMIMERDTYAGKQGCCTAGKQPMGEFCPEEGKMCNCCTSAGNRNCWPQDTSNCKTKSSCQLKGATTPNPQ